MEKQLKLFAEPEPWGLDDEPPKPVKSNLKPNWTPPPPPTDEIPF